MYPDYFKIKLSAIEEIMNRILFTNLLLLLSFLAQAQLVEVQADYNSNRDCIFSAYNNAKVPMYLHLNFADLSNTSFTETLPYVKKLTPGFNSLFTLYSENGQVPRFQYDIKSFKSDPTAEVNLNFPFLIPFKPGTKVISKNVKSIAGFRGDQEPKSWLATGFSVNPGDEVYASRQGVIVEISGEEKEGEPMTWYNTWNNSITLLQPDGTLICYRNIQDKNNRLAINQKIQAGEFLGEVVPDATNLLLLIYHNTVSGLISVTNQTKAKSDDLKFIIPQFVVDENDTEILSTSKEYVVVHPDSVRGLEMSKKEKKKILGRKR
jgi:hypothetical protein